MWVRPPRQKRDGVLGDAAKRGGEGAERAEQPNEARGRAGSEARSDQADQAESRAVERRARRVAERSKSERTESKRRTKTKFNFLSPIATHTQGGRDRHFGHVRPPHGLL
ncbi:MAG: hypothetical protein KAV00_03225, partial [Phycisphaerae bacterium]|nr:hypothetical protein [Phycisphaerae bacterium]